MPRLAQAAAAVVARQVPMQLIPKLESLVVHLDEGEERARHLDVLHALRGFQHRCDVALRRLGGEAAEIDYAIALGGGDFQGRVLAHQYELIGVTLQTLMGMADASVREYYDLLPPSGGFAERAYSEGLMLEIGDHQRSIERIGAAMEAFR